MDIDLSLPAERVVCGMKIKFHPTSPLEASNCVESQPARQLMFHPKTCTGLRKQIIKQLGLKD